MANSDGFPTWSEWQELKPEVKEFRIYESLYFANKNASWKRIAYIGGFSGAIVCLLMESPRFIGLVKTFI